MRLESIVGRNDRTYRNKIQFSMAAQRKKLVVGKINKKYCIFKSIHQITTKKNVNRQPLLEQMKAVMKNTQWKKL